LLAVLWRIGVRISEALELRPDGRMWLGNGLQPRMTVLSDLGALPLVER
jgi:hypothetical protein